MPYDSAKFGISNKEKCVKVSEYSKRIIRGNSLSKFRKINFLIFPEKMMAVCRVAYQMGFFSKSTNEIIYNVTIVARTTLQAVEQRKNVFRSSLEKQIIHFRYFEILG